MDSYNSPTTKPLFKGTQIVWYLIGLIEVLLAFRFVLKLLEANSEAWFTSFIYNITWPLTAPFAAVFSKTSDTDIVFEWTTILAMLVYWIIGYAIVKLLLISKTVSTPEAASELKKQ
jgi:uncharacterized membrane protein YhdT